MRRGCAWPIPTALAAARRAERCGRMAGVDGRASNPRERGGGGEGNGSTCHESERSTIRRWRMSRLRESGKCWRSSTRNSTAGKSFVSKRARARIAAMPAAEGRRTPGFLMQILSMDFVSVRTRPQGPLAAELHAPGKEERPRKACVPLVSRAKGLTLPSASASSHPPSDRKRPCRC